MNPIADQMDVPPGYPTPSQLMSWDLVTEKLTAARTYWLASVRPDGRPHVVPRDGTWIEDALYYGGSAATVHARNVGSAAPVTMHIGDGIESIIVEGTATIEKPTPTQASELSDASFAKYPQYGRMDPTTYESGVLVLRPARVLAWTDFGLDATPFRFP